MAQAKICDRCGRVFKEDTYLNSRYTVFDKNHEDVRVEFMRKAVGTVIDLCQECNESLEKWFSESK